MKIDYKDVYEQCKQHPGLDCAHCIYSESDFICGLYCGDETFFPDDFKTFEEYKKAVVRERLKQL